jgi:hypothetical protein
MIAYELRYDYIIVTSIIEFEHLKQHFLKCADSLGDDLSDILVDCFAEVDIEKSAELCSLLFGNLNVFAEY